MGHLRSNTELSYPINIFLICDCIWVLYAKHLRKPYPSNQHKHWSSAWSELAVNVHPYSSFMGELHCLWTACPRAGCVWKRTSAALKIFVFKEPKSHCQVLLALILEVLVALPNASLKPISQGGIREWDDSLLVPAVTVKHIKLCLDMAEAKAKGKHITFSLCSGFLAFFPNPLKNHHSLSVALFSKTRHHLQDMSRARKCEIVQEK